MEDLTSAKLKVAKRESGGYVLVLDWGQELRRWPLIYRSYKQLFTSCCLMCTHCLALGSVERELDPGVCLGCAQCIATCRAAHIVDLPRLGALAVSTEIVRSVVFAFLHVVSAGLTAVLHGGSRVRTLLDFEMIFEKSLYEAARRLGIEHRAADAAADITAEFLDTLDEFYRALDDRVVRKLYVKLGCPLCRRELVRCVVMMTKRRAHMWAYLVYLLHLKQRHSLEEIIENTPFVLAPDELLEITEI